MRGANNVSEDMVAGQVSSTFGLTFERVPCKGCAPAASRTCSKVGSRIAVLPVSARCRAREDWPPDDARLQHG